MSFHQPSTLPRGLADVRRIPKARPDPEVFLIFINDRLEITSIVWAGGRWVFAARGLEQARPARLYGRAATAGKGLSIRPGLPSGECHAAPGLAELIARVKPLIGQRPKRARLAHPDEIRGGLPDMQSKHAENGRVDIRTCACDPPGE